MQSNNSHLSIETWLGYRPLSKKNFSWHFVYTMTPYRSSISPKLPNWHVVCRLSQLLWPRRKAFFVICRKSFLVYSYLALLEAIIFSGRNNEVNLDRNVILWKHFISWGRNFVVWRRRTYSWVLDFVDCPTHGQKNKKLLPSIFDRCETKA